MVTIRKFLIFFSLVCIIFTVILGSQYIPWDSLNTDSLEGKSILFEVTSNAKGPIYPPDKTLILRVFNNAGVEFDYYLPYGPDRVGIPFSSEIKSSKINQENLNEFKSLLETIGSESKRHYKPTENIVDAKITITINYYSKNGIKQIITKHYCIYYHSQTSISIQIITRKQR